jgi:hypothetical protein
VRYGSTAVVGTLPKSGPGEQPLGVGSGPPPGTGPGAAQRQNRSLTYRLEHDMQRER